MRLPSMRRAIVGQTRSTMRLLSNRMPCTGLASHVLVVLKAGATKPPLPAPATHLQVRPAVNVRERSVGFAKSNWSSDAK